MLRWTRFNIISVTLGFAFLYLPIVLLVIFSFNESKLVTVWGGFSTKWYVSLLHNDALLDAAWVTVRVGVLSATAATITAISAGSAARTASRISSARSTWMVFTPTGSAIVTGPETSVTSAPSFASAAAIAWP